MWPPRAAKLSRTSVPPAVPDTPLQDDRLAWPGVARLLTGKLKPKPARHNGHGLFLKMVQMHRRTDIRRSKELAFQAIAVSITNDAEKGEPSEGLRAGHSTLRDLMRTQRSVHRGGSELRRREGNRCSVRPLTDDANSFNEGWATWRQNASASRDRAQESGSFYALPGAAPRQLHCGDQRRTVGVTPR